VFLLLVIVLVVLSLAVGGGIGLFLRPIVSSAIEKWVFSTPTVVGKPSHGMLLPPPLSDEIPAPPRVPREFVDRP
jgi:hypothetical protein